MDLIEKYLAKIENNCYETETLEYLIIKPLEEAKTSNLKTQYLTQGKILK